MFCSKCGKDIPDDSVFCPECGSRLTTGNNLTLSSQSSQDSAFPQKEGKGSPQGLPPASNSPRNNGLLVVVAFGWTLIMWFFIIVGGGFIIGALNPDNAAVAGERFGEAIGLPALILSGCVSAILTKLGKLPGTKKT